MMDTVASLAQGLQLVAASSLGSAASFASSKFQVSVHSLMLLLLSFVSQDCGAFSEDPIVRDSEIDVFCCPWVRGMRKGLVRV